MKATLLLYVLLPLCLTGTELVLKPLNPFPIADDAFTITLDLREDAPIMFKPWVRTADGFTAHRFVEMTQAQYLSRSRDVPLRFFIVKPGAKFAEIVLGIEKLKSYGFRQTSLRHLVALSNGDNLRNMNQGTVVLATIAPCIRGPDETLLEFDDALFGAVVDKEGIQLGFVGSGMMTKFRSVIVAFEPPLERN